MEPMTAPKRIVSTSETALACCDAQPERVPWSPTFSVARLVAWRSMRKREIRMLVILKCSRVSRERRSRAGKEQYGWVNAVTSLVNGTPESDLPWVHGVSCNSQGEWWVAGEWEAH